MWRQSGKREQVEGWPAGGRAGQDSPRRTGPMQDTGTSNTIQGTDGVDWSLDPGRRGPMEYLAANFAQHSNNRPHPLPPAARQRRNELSSAPADDEPGLDS